jgi:CRP-like cAMP-binding protein
MNFSMANDAEQNDDKLSGYLQDLEHVRGIPLFQSLDYECQKLIAMVCKRIIFHSDDPLIKHGEDAEFAYYLLSGQVGAWLPRDNENHKIRSYEQGDFIGGCSLLGKIHHIFTVQAETDTVTLRLGRTDFQRVMAKFPSNMNKIVESLVSEMSRWDKMVTTTIESDENSNKYSGVGVSLL